MYRPDGLEPVSTASPLPVLLHPITFTGLKQSRARRAVRGRRCESPRRTTPGSPLASTPELGTHHLCIKMRRIALGGRGGLHSDPSRHLPPLSASPPGAPRIISLQKGAEGLNVKGPPAGLFQVLHHRPPSMRQRHHALRPYSLPSRCSTACWRMRISSQRRAKRDLPHLCANTAGQEYDVQARGVPPRTECSPERMYPPPPPRASTPAFGSCLRRPKSIRSAGDHTGRTRPTSLSPRHALTRASP